MVGVARFEFLKHRVIQFKPVFCRLIFCRKFKTFFMMLFRSVLFRIIE